MRADIIADFERREKLIETLEREIAKLQWMIKQLLRGMKGGGLIEK